MFELRILGFDEGKHPFEIESDKVIFGESEYEFKNVVLKGELEIFKTKFEIKANLSANVDLVCDRSGKIFNQPINKNIDLLFKFNQKGVELLDDDIESDLYKLVGNKLDISKLVLEELLLEIPLKKISPDFQDIEFEKLYPKYSEDYTKKSDSEESPWNELKKINFK